MTVPMICLVIGCFLPLLWVGGTAPGRAKLPEGVDNANPRGQQARLEGFSLRARHAQDNAFEALPLFITAVFIHHATNGNAAMGANFAMGWVVCRLVHGAAYLANIHLLRSLAFMAGMAMALGLIFAT